MVIAFLMGRESARTEAREASSAKALQPSSVDPGQVDGSTEEENSRRWPAWADLTDLDPSEDRAIGTEEDLAEQIEAEPTDRFATKLDQDRPQLRAGPNAPSDEPADPRENSVGAYFQQIDLIHSEEGAGDPNVFAMNLIKGGLGGASSGFDQLIADAKKMEREMHTLTPPVSCEGFHEASIETLVESREMLERMKRAILTRDIEQLNGIALQSKTLQTKVQAMKEMRRQILASSSAH